MKVISAADSDMRQFERRALLAVPKKLMIGGIWQDSLDGRRFSVSDPSTGMLLSDCADADSDDALRALSAADAAQASWAQETPRNRSEILRKTYERLIGQIDLFSLLIALEMGKSLKEARSEVNYAADFLLWFSEEAVRIHGRFQLAPGGGLQQLICKSPVGPCLLITPWNFPLAMLARKVGPAIAAGCTMIVKPSELTPLTAGLFVELMHDAGVPPGVLNLITTTTSESVVRSLLADTRLRKLSFTGSTPVGKMLLASASGNVIRTSMELGGNAPFIVFGDADLDAAVDGAVQAKLRNIGQACTAANRFYIHESIVGEFSARLRARFMEIRLDRGVSDGDVVGPMISFSARTNAHQMVLDAVDDGAKIVMGGLVPSGPGFFYPPTILINVPNSSRVMRNEIFGPIAPICAFKEESEVIGLANDSDLGLAAYVYTRDLDRVFRIRSHLQVGMLGINAGVISDPAAPFGGVKQSGVGREGGVEGIEEYLVTQYVGIGSAVK